MFAMHDVRYRYPGAEVDAVSQLSLTVPPGELFGIVGPNGSGKTTVLRLLVGALRPTEGQATLLGTAIEAWSRRELAQAVAVVPQREEPVFPMRVQDTVFLGRYPHLGGLQAVRQVDRDAVANALDRCEVTDLSRRWVSTLSSGEWQRVRVARALAQQPQGLVLDEATANLDIRHEMQVFDLMSELVARDGLAGVVVTHNVNLTARYVHRVLVMDHGRARCIGGPHEVLTSGLLSDVFGWPVERFDWHGTPQFIPIGRSGGGVDRRTPTTDA